MYVILELLPDGLIGRLGWTLVHFVWQGMAVAIAATVVLWFLRRRSAAGRYIVSCTALLACVAVVTATFALMTPPRGVAAVVRTFIESPAQISLPLLSSEDETPTPGAVLPRGDGAAGLSDRTDRAGPGDSGTQPRHDTVPTPAAAANEPAAQGGALFERLKALGARIEPHLPWVVALWIAGILLLSTRLLYGWVAVQRIRRRYVAPAAGHCQRVLSDAAARLRVSRPVRVLTSALVQVPVTIGWVRPVILLPVSALTGLSEEQLRALLAHELAHIRRYDYLVNLLQSVVETLLFYHPAVWWLSRRIRVEREHCCDDLAVACCGDSLLYARTLAAMEELRGAPPLAAAATGGPLIDRIRRVLGLPSRSACFATPVSGIAAFIGIAIIAAVALRVMTPVSAATAPAALEIAGTPATQPDQPTPAELPWGEGRDGVQIRVRPLNYHWYRGEAPLFMLEARNQGQRRLAFPQSGRRAQVEVDGQWYHWDIDRKYDKPAGQGGSGHYSSLISFDPGRELTHLTVSLGEGWQRVREGELEELAFRQSGPGEASPSEKPHEPLKLAPGKHTIRIASTVGSGYPSDRNLIRVVSNPVEIVMDEVKQSEAAKKPSTNAPGTGLRLEASVRPSIIRAGEAIDVSVDVVNDGPQTIRFFRPHHIDMDSLPSWRLTRSDGAVFRPPWMPYQSMRRTGILGDIIAIQPGGRVPFASTKVSIVKPWTPDATKAEWAEPERNSQDSMLIPPGEYKVAFWYSKSDDTVPLADWQSKHIRVGGLWHGQIKSNEANLRVSPRIEAYMAVTHREGSGLHDGRFTLRVHNPTSRPVSTQGAFVLSYYCKPGTRAQLRFRTDPAVAPLGDAETFTLQVPAEGFLEREVDLSSAPVQFLAYYNPKTSRVEDMGGKLVPRSELGNCGGWSLRFEALDPKASFGVDSSTTQSPTATRPARQPAVPARSATVPAAESSLDDQAEVVERLTQLRERLEQAEMLYGLRPRPEEVGGDPRRSRLLEEMRELRREIAELEKFAPAEMRSGVVGLVPVPQTQRLGALSDGQRLPMTRQELPTTRPEGRGTASRPATTQSALPEAEIGHHRLTVRIRDFPRRGAESVFNPVVDGEGYIELAGIGRFLVRGMTPSQVRDAVSRRLTERNFRSEQDPATVTVTFPKIEQMFHVMGNVRRPGVYALPMQRMTLGQAVAAAGGISESLAGEQVVCNILRVGPDGKATTRSVDLSAILRGKEAEIAIEAGDLLNVGAKGPTG